MSQLKKINYGSPLVAHYVDVGTGQAIASGIVPFLAPILSFFLGIFGFLLIRFKKIFKKKSAPKKECPSKKPSSSA